MPRPAIIALQIKRPPKTVWNLLTWRQAAYLLPTCVLCLFLILSIPFDHFYIHFVSKLWAILLRIITGLFISLILVGIASVLAFVPACYIPWLNPKPKKSTDPNMPDQMLDAYIIQRIKHHRKTKVLPWRGSDYS